jgi:hypothetical protein
VRTASAVIARSKQTMTDSLRRAHATTTHTQLFNTKIVFYTM